MRPLLDGQGQNTSTVLLRCFNIYILYSFRLQNLLLMTEPITLLLADDHTVYRTGFQVSFTNMKEVHLDGVVADYTSLLRLLLRYVPDVVLIALNLPGALDACREVRRLHPQTCIVILMEMYYDTAVTRQLSAAGATGFASKLLNPEPLVNYLKKLLGREELPAPEVLPPAAAEGRSPLFTKNEVDVLHMLCNQMDSDEIGKQLYLSKHTIDSMRKTLIQKCGVKGTVGLVMYAVRNGIVKA
jgi:DNA-binding NarL/FixJ family response regulator